jgi:hypothetical protein
MVYILSRRVEIFLTIFFSLILLPGGLYAQKGAEDYLIVERLSRENGLPDQDINGIYFDSKGYAWISTFGRGTGQIRWGFFRQVLETDVSEHCRRLYQSVLRG